MKIERYKHDSSGSFALGMTLTIELLKCRPELVERVFLSPQLEKSGYKDYLEELMERNHVPSVVSEKAFNVLSPKGNCFVIGQFKKFASELKAEALHLCLVNPSDAGNMGTIMRTMVGFGVHDLAVVRPAVDAFDPRTVRASMGALFHLRVKYYDDFSEYQKEFPKYKPYPFMLRNSVPIHGVTFEEPCTLVFGNEGSGLPDDFDEVAQTAGGQAVLIPHSGEIDSLNLPMAAGIGLFEATKKYWKGDT